MTVDAGALTEAIWNRLCELPDRNSPEDDPEACVCSITELRGCVGDALDELNAAPAPSASPAALTDADIERQYKDGIHIGSGLPRATCPCGFCQKYREPRRLAASPADQVEDAHVDDLVMLVRRRVRALRAIAPRHVVADEAVRYLKHKGLQGSPLRAAIGETPQDS